MKNDGVLEKMTLALRSHNFGNLWHLSLAPAKDGHIELGDGSNSGIIQI